LVVIRGVNGGLATREEIIYFLLGALQTTLFRNWSLVYNTVCSGSCRVHNLSRKSSFFTTLIIDDQIPTLATPSLIRLSVGTCSPFLVSLCHDHSRSFSDTALAVDIAPMMLWDDSNRKLGSLWLAPNHLLGI
jgi:hypothetical protein